MPTTKQEYENLQELFLENIRLVPKDKILNRQDFTTLFTKEKGDTVGFIGELKKSGSSFMVKKTERFRESENMPKTLSRDYDMKQGAIDSFNELRGAIIFSLLKGEKGYGAEFYLVTSPFKKNKDKLYNRLRKDNIKVYVASFIKGNPKDVNNSSQELMDLASGRSSKLSENKDHVLDAEERNQKRQLLLDDLAQNAIIMAIISNYDIKLDNFWLDESKTQAIPIDFGNTGLHENTSDIVSGLSFITGYNDTFSSRSLSKKQHLESSNGSDGIRKFYSKTIKAEHFLKFIKKIEANQEELEEQIWAESYRYTFGDPELKQASANNTLARLRNLMKLKVPINEWIKGKSKVQLDSFGQRDLRSIWSQSKSFQEKCKEEPLTKEVSEGFDLLNETQVSIIKELSNYQKASRQQVTESKADEDSKEPETLLSIQARINTLIDTFNQNLAPFYEKIEAQFNNLEETHKESLFLSKDSTADFKKVPNYKENKTQILKQIATLIELLSEPLITNDDQDHEVDTTSESSKSSSDESDQEALDSIQFNPLDLFKSPQLGLSLSNQSSDHTNNSSSSQGSSSDISTIEERGVELRLSPELGQENSKWDLSDGKYKEYIEGAQQVLEMLIENKDKIARSLLPMMTHFDSLQAQHDVSQSVEKNNFQRKVNGWMDEKEPPIKPTTTPITPTEQKEENKESATTNSFNKGPRQP